LNLRRQVSHDFLSHTGEFEGNGIQSEFLDCDSDMLMMPDCSRGKNDTLRDQVVLPDKM
jgi:hypothetical protein